MLVLCVLLSGIPATAAAESYTQAVEATVGLSHFWPMGESSGSSFTDVFGGADASIAGGVTLGKPGGLVGDGSTSALFDGSSGAASASVDLSGTHELTVEFWLKWPVFGDDDALALEFTPNFNENAGGFLVDPNASNEGGMFGIGVGEGGSRNNVFFTQPSAEAWHYYAFVINTEASAETEITPYVDGEAVSYTKTSSGTGVGNLADSTLYWMSRNASSLFGAGAMQDLALYEGTLSSGTILDHYEIGEGGPKASFAASPVVASVGVPVHFDASGSTSPAGSITDYAWDFDGSEDYSSDAGSSVTKSHTFSSPGTYTVDLRVKDSLGETSTVSHTITVGAELSRYAQTVEGTSSVSHFWPMGESSGSSFVDVFGGTDATITGGVTLGEPSGLAGDPTTSALFDGSSGAASASVDLSGTHELTVEFWMKWKAFAGDDRLALEFTPNFNENAGGFLVDPDASDEGGLFGIGVGEGASRNNVFFVQPSAEAWHYYAFVIDTEASAETEITPYVDGKAVSYTKTASGTGVGNLADSTLYWMSRNASSLFGKGAMQDLALYHDALSSGTILDHYEIGEGGPKASFASLPVVASVGVPVRLDASGSTSPTGSITDYAWDFNGSRSYSTDAGSTTSRSHTFTSPGAYTVDLRVKDSLGETATISHTITVGAELSHYAQTVEGTSGVSHFWPMGESSGSSFADVFGGADATITGGVTLGELSGLAADASTSALFDGSSGAASASVDLSDTHELTVEFWLKWPVFGDDDALALEFTPNFNENAGGFLVDPNASNEGGLFGIGVGEGASRNNVFFTQPSAEAWHYYAFVINTEASAETEITPYVDGKAVSYTKTASGTGVGNLADSTLYWMSRNASNLFGKGDMQNLALYAGTLSVGAIEHHYETGTAVLLNTTPPSVTGVAQDGRTLTVDPGVWTGPEPISHTYQWQRCDESEGEEEADCADIPGATNATYRLGLEDVGSAVRVTVTASDSSGSAVIASEATLVVAAGLGDSLQFGSLGLGEGKFDQPGDVKLDPAGDVWVLDSGNSQVQEFNEDGEYLKEFGVEGSENGQLNHPTGLAIDLSEDVWIADTGNDRVEEFNEDGEYIRSLGSSGSGTGQLAAPEGIAIDASGNVWVSDTGNARVEVFSETGEYLKTVGTEGSEEERLAEPEGLTINTKGDVWVADFASARVEEFNEDGEFLRVVGSGGEAPEKLESPYGVAVDENNDIWVGDVGSDRVVEYSEDGIYLQYLGSPGRDAGQFSFRAPMGLAIDSAETVWIADSANNRVVKWAPADAPSNTVAPVIIGATSAGQTLSARNGTWVGSSPRAYRYQWQSCNSEGSECNDISGATNVAYVLDEGDIGSTLRVTVSVSNPGGTLAITSDPTAKVSSGFSSGLVFSSKFGSSGSGSGQFGHPSAIAVAQNGNLWVVDRDNERVEGFDSRGEYVASIGEDGDGPLNDPNGVAIDPSGNVWVLDRGRSRIEELDEQGNYIFTINPKESEAGWFGLPGGIAVDAHDDIWVSDSEDGSIKEFDAQGGYIKTVEGVGANKLSEPEGVAVDVQGDVWVVDASTDRVEEFNEAGEFLREFGSSGSGSGHFDEPYAIALDPLGNVWVGDVGNNRVEEFNEEGEYLYKFGSSGTETGKFKLEAPMGIAADASGNIWVADSNNNRVQEFTPPALPPSNITSPHVYGEPFVGETLSAMPGRWSGLPPITYTYQWRQCDEGGEECFDIPEATGPSYTLSEADSGKTIEVAITASNREGSATESGGTPEISHGFAPSNAVLPTVSGTAQDGQTLSASTGTWTGTIPLSYTYQWERCNASSEGCSAIEDATGPEYTLGRDDVGATLQVIVSTVNVAGSTDATSSPTTVVQAEAPSEIQAPSISGVPDVHQMLHADTGVWAGTRRELSYQWESCNSSGEACATIKGETDSDYDAREGDDGNTLRVRIGVNSTLGALTDVSPPTPVIGEADTLANTSTPQISGTTQVGETLKASAGTWSGSGPISYTYQWQNCEPSGLHCEDIEGATSANYGLEAGVAGDKLLVVVSATDEAASQSATSVVTQPISAAHTPVLEHHPVLSGTALQGYTLAATEGMWVGDGPITYSYQWERCSTGGECAPIEGATASTYALTGGDVESVVRVLVSAANEEGTSTGVSNATTIVEAESLQSFSSPSISGVIQVGGTLTAEPGIWSGSGPISYAYQWERCNASGEECSAIEDATEATYLVASGDLGSSLRVDVTLTNPQGSQNAHSSHTVVVPGGERTVAEDQEVAQETDPAVLAYSTTETIEEQTVSPGLTDTEEELVSTGTLTSSTVSKEDPGEFGVNTPVGPLSLTPLEPSQNATSTPTIVNGTVALFANTFPATDAIVRPDVLGATTILQLRSSESPTSFSWEVHLGASQELKQLADGSVAVINAPETTNEPEGQQPSQEPKSLANAVEGQPETSTEKEEREEEEAQPESEAEVPLETLPEAPTSSISPAETPPGQPEPQDTQKQYETATASMSTTETHTGGQTLMVIDQPTVIDTTGETVPATLSIRGATITLTLKPSSETTFPAMAELTIAAHSDKTSAAQHPVHYGLADDTPEAFTELDPNIKKTTAPLHVTTARLVIPYDTFSNPKQERERKRLQEWLAAAKNDHLKTYLTIGKDFGCKKNDKECLAPSLSTYRARFAELFNYGLARGVKIWGAWNEPDLGEGLKKLAPRAARYWQEAHSILAEHCGGCRLVAGEFSFTRNPWRSTAKYIEEYRKTLLDHHSLCKGCKFGKPSIWGVHDYHDVVANSKEYAEKFRELTKGRAGAPQVIVSEAAVELENNGERHTSIDLGSKTQREKRQTKAAKDFLELHRVSQRVEQVYYYEYRAPTEAEVEREEVIKKLVFDSGLFEARPEPSKPDGKITSKGEARAAYCYLAFSSHSCAPTVVTLPVVAGLSEHAVVTPNGRATKVYFQWTNQGGTAGKYTGTGEQQAIGSGLTPVEVIGRSSCGRFHYRAAAINSGGTTRGQDEEQPNACS